MYFLFAKQLRDSGLPADVLVGKLNKDISFELRRGTIAQVTTHALDGCACSARARPSRMRSSSSTRRAGIARQSLSHLRRSDSSFLSSFLHPPRSIEARPVLVQVEMPWWMCLSSPVETRTERKCRGGCA